MIKRIVIGLLLLGGVGAIIQQGLKPKPPKSEEVTTAKVARESITRTVAAVGKLGSSSTVKINSNLSGDLVELDVKVGDRVKKGQVLGRIDPTRYKAQAKSAAAADSAAEADVSVERVAVAHAAVELTRMEALLKKGLASDAEVEQARSTLEGEKAKQSSSEQRVAQSQGQLDEAKDFLSKTTLSSPIDGEVIELDRQKGERVRGSDFSEDVIMILAALNEMEVKMEVGEHEVVYLKVNDKAEIEVDAIEGKKFPAHVMEIGQNAIVRNPGTESEVTTFPIRVALDDRPPGALPGMSATVRVSTETHDKTLVVPIQCVTVRPEKMLAKPASTSETAALKVAGVEEKKSELAKVVFLVKDGKAQLRRVKTGLSSELGVEILEGLAEGDEVVEGPYRTLAKDLKDGEAVAPPKADANSDGNKS